MKVKLPQNYKHSFTVKEYEQAKAVIASERDSSFTTKDWAEMALSVLCSHHNWTAGDILVASAEVCRNNRIRDIDLYGDDTGHMDVTISATARIWGNFGNGFGQAYIEIWAHLSDIWQCGDKQLFNASHITYSLFPHQKH